MDELLTRGVANIIPGKKQLEEILSSGKKLNIYLGIDPTATKIHLGHAVALRKLQAFAEAGHHVTFLIGDFTAFIGDTSDKNSERPILGKQEIELNFQTYKQQAEKILDFSKIEIKYNSEWLANLSFSQIIQFCQSFSVGDFVGRELIKRRLDENKRVGLHEVLYPVLQGIDSLELKTDLQIGGTDQTFNMQAGRTLQKHTRNKDSFILSTDFLMGTDGRKMSKSWGNAIWLDDEPDDMYRKIMAITDEVILQYYILATNVSLPEIAKIEKQLAATDNPMDIKKQLANIIVTELHNKTAAEQAAAQFKRIVQEKELPTEVPTITWEREGSLVDFLLDTELAQSKSHAKQLIKQGGITIDGQQIEESPNEPFIPVDNQIIGVGKKKFARISTKR